MDTTWITWAVLGTVDTSARAAALSVYARIDGAGMSTTIARPSKVTSKGLPSWSFTVSASAGVSHASATSVISEPFTVTAIGQTVGPVPEQFRQS